MVKKIIISVLVLLTIFFSIFLVRRFWHQESQIAVPDTTVTTTPSSSQVQVYPILRENIPYDEKVYQEDSDLDGLSNIREQEIGTNPNSGDSDSDGLQDKDEVELWKTDPLRTDSDDDGFADGFEVLQGYKPNGDGQLEQ